MKKLSLLLFLCFLLFSCGEKKKSHDELFREADKKMDNIIDAYANDIVKKEKVDFLFDTLKPKYNFTIYHQKIFKNTPKTLILDRVHDIVDADTCLYIYIKKTIYGNDFIRIKSKNRNLVENLYDKITSNKEVTTFFIVATIKKVSKYFLAYNSEHEGYDNDDVPECRINIDDSPSSRFFDAELDTIYFANLRKQVIFPIDMK